MKNDFIEALKESLGVKICASSTIPAIANLILPIFYGKDLHRAMVLFVITILMTATGMIVTLIERPK